MNKRRILSLLISLLHGLNAFYQEDASNFSPNSPERRPGMFSPSSKLLVSHEQDFLSLTFQTQKALSRKLLVSKEEICHLPALKTERRVTGGCQSMVVS